MCPEPPGKCSPASLGPPPSRIFRPPRAPEPKARWRGSVTGPFGRLGIVAVLRTISCRPRSLTVVEPTNSAHLCGNWLAAERSGNCSWAGAVSRPEVRAAAVTARYRGQSEAQPADSPVSCRGFSSVSGELLRR